MPSDDGGPAGGGRQPAAILEPHAQKLELLLHPSGARASIAAIRGANDTRKKTSAVLPDLMDHRQHRDPGKGAQHEEPISPHRLRSSDVGQVFADLGKKLARTERFGYIAIATGRTGFGLIAAQGVGRHGDDRD
jgi:hypothetical protein